MISHRKSDILGKDLAVCLRESVPDSGRIPEPYDFVVNGDLYAEIFYLRRDFCHSVNI